MPKRESLETVSRICRRIRDLDIPNEKSPNGQRITLSAGVVNVAVTEQTDTIIEIANYADKALYHAKKAGKDAIYLLDRESRDAQDKDPAYVRIEF